MTERSAIFPFVERKWLYFAISALILVPGAVFLALGGLKPGIEFRGGSLLDARFEAPPATAVVDEIMTGLGHPEAQVQAADGGRIQVRTLALSPDEIAATEAAFEERFAGNFRDVQASTVSPSFSVELVANAIQAVVAASALVVLLVAFAFRSYGWGAFRYGLAAIAALVHDAFFVLGLFAILGYFFNVEVDSLFVTAVLTIIGFSVHDTIVVFDRIRENLKLNPGEPVNAVINFSIMQTAARSVITSFTTLLTLFALYGFGGYSIQNFALALIVGILAGTYSSIFNAAQVISLWQEVEDRLRGRRRAPAPA